MAKAAIQNSYFVEVCVSWYILVFLTWLDIFPGFALKYETLKKKSDFILFVRDMVSYKNKTYCRTTLTHSNGLESFCGKLVVTN